MSMKVFEGFKFTKIDTPMHNMDPRAKFTIIASIFILALLFSELLPLLVLFIIQIPLVFFSKTIKKWIGSLRGAVYLAGLIFAMNFLTGSSLTLAFSMTFRFLSLISSFSLFFMTTSPDDLGLALEEMKIPYALTFTFTTAVRLVPTIATDAQTVIDAQKSRGLELEKGNILKRIRNHVPILIPLIVTAIRRSMELAEALETRGFGASSKREPMIILKLKLTDYIAASLAASLVIIGIYIKYYISLPLIEIPYRIPKIFPFLILSLTT